MSNKTPLALLERQYAQLDSNFEKVYTSCPTDAQKVQFRQDYTVARDNFWEALNREFKANDPFVKSLLDELGETQSKIEEMLVEFEDIVELLKTITAGVRLASSLIVMGSSL